MASIRNTPQAGDGVTIIGESVQVRGHLSGDEDLHVLGRVDGRVELQRTLVVAHSGIVKAEVSVKNAVISGVVVGNIHASESVELTKEGRMVGDIYAPRIIIVDGASFRGNVDMGDLGNMPARKPGTERPRPAPAVRPASTVTARPAAASTTPTVVAKAPEVRVEKAPEPKREEPKPAPRPAAPSEPPAAGGLPQTKRKARVIVKRK